MAGDGLSTPVKKKIRRASRQRMEDVARSRLKRNYGQQRWLCKSNRYGRKVVDRLQQDAQGNRIAASHFREYLAACGPAHLIDGWSYLGRASDALLRGDPAAAIHLAYYAELRAAASLLAAHGIGVLSQKHAVVVETGDVEVFSGGGGTHRFIWPALEWWSRPKRTQEALLSCLKAGGIGLWQWLTAFQAGTSANAVGSGWLATWGMDLRRMTLDHFARNESSYRPSEYRSSSTLTAAAATKFVASLWRLFEPGAEGQFEAVDRWLLRRAIEESFIGIRGARPAEQPGIFEADVTRMLKSMPLDPGEAETWRRFFMRREHAIDPEPIVFSEGRTAGNDGVLAPHVMSRAALLLRLATGSTSSLLRTAGISGSELDFWWKRFGVERGLWVPGQEPAHVTDSWADIEASLIEAERWYGQVPARGFRQLRGEVPTPMIGLGAFDVVPTWGLAS